MLRTVPSGYAMLSGSVWLRPDRPFPKGDEKQRMDVASADAVREIAAVA